MNKMMHDKIRIVLIFLFIIIIIGVCGCDNDLSNTNNSSNEFDEKDNVSNEDKMKEYINNKYGFIDCSTIRYTESGWDQSYDTLYLSLNSNGEKFFVNLYDDGTIRDSYYGIAIRDDFEKEIIHCIDNQFKDYKIITRGLSDVAYPSDLKTDDPINELIRCGNDIDTIVFFIFVNDDSISSDEDFNNTSKAIIDKWNQLGILSLPRIISINANDFNLINENNYSEYIMNGYEYSE